MIRPNEYPCKDCKTVTTLIKGKCYRCYHKLKDKLRRDINKYIKKSKTTHKKMASYKKLKPLWKKINEHEEERELTKEELKDAKVINDEFKCKNCYKQMIRIRQIGLRCIDCNKEEFNKNQ